MNSKGGTVTFDAEEFLQLLDELANLEKRLRNLGREGYKVDSMTTTPSRHASREKKEKQDAMEIDIDISGIEWRLSNRDGGGAADLSDGWAWAFAYHKNGQLRDETRQLVEEINRYGKVEVSGYEITLSGRDKNLLSRKKLKSRGR